MHIAATRLGREHWQRLIHFPRHRHTDSYAALVLAGGYEECGCFGRFQTGPGSVVLHTRFDAHLDRFGTAKSEILNLPLPVDVPIARIAKLANPDAIVRLAERDPAAAAVCVLAELIPAAGSVCDWPDRLAEDLALPEFPGLTRWARDNALAPETVTRGFVRSFGVTPSRFRLERRAHDAFARIIQSRTPLAQIAVESGFSDQPHMTRTIRSLTGAVPSYWRRQMI
ncbi:MAG: helix-turn-helix transcriptional regulator [Alphaproteobacteria bacterium]|nr:helix-turn-helix transcriptional regulator [Alphaproteobacteria bacterium]